jgi:uncharacterized protein YyaL (SSP411 family)
LLSGPVEIALVGPPGREDTEALARALGGHFLPHRIVSPVDPGDAGERTPLGRDKGLVDGKAALYVCRNFTCEAPVTAAEALEQVLSKDREKRVRGSAVG